jgi:hypothetical protein
MATKLKKSRKKQSDVAAPIPFDDALKLLLNTPPQPRTAKKKKKK